MVQWSPCLVHWTPRVGTNDPMWGPMNTAIFSDSIQNYKIMFLHFVLQCLLIILHKETVRFFGNCSIQVENKKSGSMDPTLPYREYIYWVDVLKILEDVETGNFKL